MDRKEEQFEKLIAPVHFFMHLSRLAYSKYLDNKILLHASNIYSSNRKIRNLLESYPALLPAELFEDALSLLNHYGIWMSQFDEFKANHSFQLQDVFVFHQLDNQSAFPKDAELHFFEYYNRLKKELSYD